METRSIPIRNPCWERRVAAFDLEKEERRILFDGMEETYLYYPHAQVYFEISREAYAYVKEKRGGCLLLCRAVCMFDLATM